MISQKEIIKILKKGGVGVIMTDTIYGIVGSALFKKTVERIFNIKKRNPKKPPIILLHSQEQLVLFDIHLDEATQKILSCLWPGKVSVILPCSLKKFIYLHKGSNALAFRIPKRKRLRELLEVTGPLIAPSANLEGLPPAQSIKEAKKYFDDSVDFYVIGVCNGNMPSTLVSLNKERYKIIRNGAVSERKISQCVIKKTL